MFKQVVLISTIVLVQGKLNPSKVVSLFPGLYDLSQHALVHVYSSNAINATYRLVDEYSGKIIYSNPDSYYSQPISANLHRVEFRYNNPSVRIPLYGQISKVEVLVDFCDRTPTGKFVCRTEQPTIHLFHELLTILSDPSIMIETDKTRYRPGEHIQIHCSLIRTEWWTTYGVTNLTRVESWNEATGKSMQFSSIDIHSSNGQIMQSWKNVHLDQGRNLTYVIPKNPVDYGRWRITVTVGTYHSKGINIMVLPDASAIPIIRFFRPHWILQQPTHIWGKPPHLTLTVCANDSAGHLIQGPVQILLCDCRLSSQYYEYRDTEQVLTIRLIQTLFHYHACPDDWNNPISGRPCAVRESIFDSRGCQSFELPVIEIGFQSNRFGTTRISTLISCVRLWDSGMNGWYEHCTRVYADRQSFGYSSGYKLDTPFYKYGLPTVIDMHTDDIPLPGAPIDIILEQQLNYCPLTQNRSLDPFHRNTLRYILQFDRHGLGQIQMRPLYTFDDLTLTTNHLIWGQQSTVLRGYYTSSKAMIQPWPKQGPFHVNCNETVQVVIMGNQPLIDKHFFVYGSVRGSLFPIQLADYTSQDLEEDSVNLERDDWLGHHFERKEEDPSQLSCLPGWHGDGCLKPVCGAGCDTVGGYCMFPGGCECHKGWVGLLCDRCAYCGFNWSCTTGSECSCPWYYTNQECTPYNATLPPISLMTPMQHQSYASDLKSRKLLHKRTLRLIVNWTLNKPTPVSIFYLEPMSDEALDVVVTRITLLPGRACPATSTTTVNTKGYVQFNTSQTWIDESVKLRVVVPAASKLMNGTVCHLIVRNVPTSGLVPHQTLFSWHKAIDDQFEAVVTPNSIQNFPFSSVRELWDVGLSEGLDPKETKFKNYRGCGFYQQRGRDTFQSTESESDEQRTIFFTSFQPTELSDVSNLTGAWWTLKVPSAEASWQASVFCYGPQLGLWTDYSNILMVRKPIEFRVTTSRSVRPYEKVVIQSHAQITPTDESQCVFLSVQVTMMEQSVGWDQIGPTTQLQCLCGPPYKRDWSSYAQPGILAADGLFKVTLNVFQNAPQCSLTIADLLRTTDYQSFTRSDNIVFFRETRFARIRVDQHFLDNWQSTAFLCSPEMSKTSKKTKQDQIVFNVPELQTNFDSNPDQYLSISSNLMGSFLRLFELRQNKPLLSGYDHLARVVTGIHVLNYLVEESKVNQLLLENLRSKVFHTVVTSVYALTGLNCTNGMYGALGGNCTQDDPWFESLLYRAMADVLRCRDRWIKKSLEDYVNAIVWYVEKRWARIQNEDGCFSPPPSTGKDRRRSFRLALTAHRWISLYEHSLITSHWPQEIDIELLLSRAQSCLYKEIANEVGNTDSMTKHPPIVLTLFARALTTADRRSPVSINLVKWIRRIQIREDSHMQNETLMHWGSNEDDAIEATTNAYWILRQYSQNLTSFLPVIRWILTKQDINGDFPGPRDLYFASSLIANYSEWVSLSNVGDGLLVRIQVHPEGHPARNFQIVSGNLMEKFLRLPRTKRVKVTLSVLRGSPCFVIKLAQSAISKRVQLLPESKLATIRCTNKSGCNHVSVSVCLEPTMFRRIAALYIQPQSGWDIDSWTRELFTKPKNPFPLVRSAYFDEMDNMHILLQTRTEHIKGSCFSMNYTQTSIVLNSRPLLVIAIGPEFMRGEYLYNIRLPQNGIKHDSNGKDALKSNTKVTLRLTKCPRVEECNPTNNDDILRRFEQLCSSGISLFYLNQTYTRVSETLTAWTYTIWNDTRIAKWPTEVAPRLKICPLFDRTNVFVVLPNPYMKNSQSYSNLGVVSPTVRLVRMTRKNRGTNELLQTLASPCSTLQTMIRLVYGILI
ncbi:hypothetical protein FBUS_03740 [Fasciolopsis buskii]|uniref:EGF-like domain-containing protein n=1 Tax=Fasciolopsis buskii TaxID=27845 RepID=A0A8E0VCU3_9TREM|nr:hypothetical protein FBUS_03740 [Fasciolopsis buski]